MTTSTESYTSPDGLDLVALTEYLRSEHVPLRGRLAARLISGGRSNLTYVVTDGASRWVLRRPPLGQVLKGAHDVAREHRVMSGLAATAVPVPTTVALCRDESVLGVEFYLMDEVVGRVLRTPQMVEPLPVPTRTALGHSLVDTLADLHDADYTAAGLADLGRPDGYLQRQVDRWVRQYGAIKDRELPHVDAVVASLRDGMPATQGVSVVHGDYRLDNVMVGLDDPTRIAAVLDWEMATLGDPLADLGMLLMFWDEVGRPFNPITAGLMASEGFPSRDDVVQRYVTRRGLQVDNLDWYVVFSQFKLAIILEQMHVRHRTGQTRGDGFEGLGQMVVDLLESARDDIERSPRLRAPTGTSTP
jgi:aminoglycoside phosphotransferase (APT) family kinase protein